MVSLRDTKTSDVISKAADELKKVKELEMPEWAKFVKTGAGKERPPAKNDWWHMRAASVLRRIALTGPIGVAKLRTKYSTKKNMGHKPERVYKAGGKVLRTILQQLEKAGLIRYTEKGVHKGRILTPKGQSFLSKAAKPVKQ
ncbi:MAG: 30S ribosomal protein S19e [archaeon]